MTAAPPSLEREPGSGFLPGLTSVLSDDFLTEWEESTQKKLAPLLKSGSSSRDHQVSVFSSIPTDYRCIYHFGPRKPTTFLKRTTDGPLTCSIGVFHRDKLRKVEFSLDGQPSMEDRQTNASSFFSLAAGEDVRETAAFSGVCLKADGYDDTWLQWNPDGSVCILAPPVTSSSFPSFPGHAGTAGHARTTGTAGHAALKVLDTFRKSEKSHSNDTTTLASHQKEKRHTGTPLQGDVDGTRQRTQPGLQSSLPCLQKETKSAKQEAETKNTEEKESDFSEDVPEVITPGHEDYERCRNDVYRDEDEF